LGMYEDFDSVVKLVPLGREFEPRSEHRPTYQELYQSFRQLYEQLAPIYGQLNI